MIDIRKKYVFFFSLNAVFLSDKKDKTVFLKIMNIFLECLEENKQ